MLASGKKVLRKARKTFLQKRAATQNGAVRRGAYLGGGYMVNCLERNVMGVSRLGGGVRLWDLCAFFQLVALPTKSYNRNDNCE